MLTKFLKNIKESNDTGFSNQVSKQGAKFYDKEGNLNVVKRGVAFGDKFSIYQELLTMSWWKFIVIVLVFYFLINTIFSLLYLSIGIHELGGIEITNNKFDMYLEAYFFSAQTFTTVGYGSVHPNSMKTNFIASIESLMGLFSFALGTGLLYGRVSKPVIKLVFSDNALMAPYKEERAFMFRFANIKDSFLSDVEAKIIFALTINEKGTDLRRFFNVKLESSKINSLALSWTVVHHIDLESPLWNLTKEDLEKCDFEAVISISCFENTSSQYVTKRYSYTHDEIFWGGKFDVIFNKAENSDFTEIHLDRLNEFKTVSLPDFNTIKTI